MERGCLSKLRSATTVVVVIALAAGCGEGGSEATTDGAGITVSAGSLSKQEFADRADRICAKTKADLFPRFRAVIEESERSDRSPSAQAAAVVKRVLVPLYRRLIDRIAAIGSPPGDEERVERFLTTVEQELEEAEGEPRQALNKLSPFERSAKVAESLGLNGCSRSLA